MFNDLVTEYDAVVKEYNKFKNKEIYQNNELQNMNGQVKKIKNEKQAMKARI
jgi:archaellum component FlaC